MRPPHLDRAGFRGFTCTGALVLSFLLHAQTIGYPVTSQVRSGEIAARLNDFAMVPLPTSLSGRLSRVSAMRFEPIDTSTPPFTSRAFVADLEKHLYVLDLNTRTFTPYINFLEVFAKFVDGSSYGAGLAAFAFHPEYAHNGKFYTVHSEGPTRPGSTIPSNAWLSGLDLSGGYTPTESIDPPEGTVSKHAVLIEWADVNLTNITFEGTAREVLRVGFSNGNHSIADIGFNPGVEAGDPDFANLYVALGDGGAGQQDAQDTSIPQRLDALPGKILRITPDLDRHPADLLSSNGRYRIPSTGVDPNPFVEIDFPGIRQEIFAYGFRNPQRMSWDAVTDTLIVADIGLYSWEELNIVRKGANYGYSEREGPEQLLIGGLNDRKTGSQTLPPTPHPEPDLLTVSGLSESVTPRYPAAAYSHHDGDAIAGGFVYRGTLLPELYGKYIFGDITTARTFYIDLNELRAADDDDPDTLATIHELQVMFDHPDDTPDRGAVPARLFDVIADQYARRGGNAGDGARLPQASDHMSDGDDTHGVPYGGGRADIRFAVDRHGELYVLSKSDGMIRRFVASRIGATATALSSSPNPSEAGDAVTLSASVTAAAGLPAGSVAFFEGSTSLGTAPLVSGSASLVVGSLTAGRHVFTARFVPEGTGFLESVGGVTHFAGQPDLVSVVSLQVAAAAPGTQLPFTDSTANVGEAIAAASTTKYFLSADSLYGGDIPIGSRLVGALAAGETSSGSLAPKTSASTPLGIYYVIGCADATDMVAERDENNCRPSATAVRVTRPDLMSTWVQPATPFVAPGATLMVGDTVHNQGGIASTSSTTRFYFSADALKSADDRLLGGGRSVVALAAGASSSKSATKLTVPAATPMGFYRLLACADDTTKNLEISEANNCTAAAGQVQVGRADLVITSISNAPLEIAPGKTFSATAATANHGTASSLSSTTRLYLSADATKDASDVLLTPVMSVAGLLPGQTTSTKKTMTVHGATPDGAYRLLACSDDTNTTIELTETNNCTAAAAAVQVKRPDLVQTAVTNPPATTGAGNTFSVTDTAVNVGAIASGSTTTRYYLSLDTVKTLGDVMLTATRSVPSLNPGASSTGTKLVTVPALASGSYHLLACGDDNGVTFESREDNNCVASAATTVVP